jgi:hypothetical protein
MARTDPTHRLPGSCFALDFAFSAALNSWRSFASGEGVEKDEALSRSEKAFAGFSALVEVNRAAQEGTALRGSCLRPNVLAMRAPSRREAMVLRMGMNCTQFELSSFSRRSKIDLSRGIGNFQSPDGLGRCYATCGWWGLRWWRCSVKPRGWYREHSTYQISTSYRSLASIDLSIHLPCLIFRFVVMSLLHIPISSLG